MQTLFQDLRYAFRQLQKSPGFAFTVVLTLALSVGVATAVFCVIDTVILRPLPYVHPERIISVESRSRSGYTQPDSWPSFVDERAQSKAFQSLAAYTDASMTMETPSGPVKLKATWSTDNLFSVFGVQPLLGRTYLHGEEEIGHNEVVVLSHDVWQRYFGAQPDAIGKTVHLEGRTYTVIGVMPADFRFPLSAVGAIYTPLRFDRSWMRVRGNNWLRLVGRLADGVTMEQAQADRTRVLNDIGRAFPANDGGRVSHLIRLQDRVNSDSKGPLWILLGAVLAVLAIGCVNVAGLLLARGVKREREMAMRVAIGAGRSRLLRQVLTEGVVLALIGAAGGVLLAWAMLEVTRAFLIHALARGADVELNWVVLGVAVGIAVTASLAASLYPALRLSGVDPNRALKAGGSSGTDRSQHRLRSSFVVTQVALTMVLLLVAGLLLRVVSRYRHTELGFEPTHLLSARINLSRANYQGRDMLANFYRPLEERVRRIPGVQSAGLISLLPIEASGMNSDIHIAGQPPYPPNQEMLAENRMVSAGYFDVMGIPLHRGRNLSPGLDHADNPSAAVVVNDAFVKKFIPAGLDPLTQRIDDGDKPEDWTRIVGVVGNVRQDIYEPALAERDFLIDAVPKKISADNLSSLTLLVRTSGDPMQVIPALRFIVHDLDPTVPFEAPRTMTDVVSETLVFERMESWLFGIFATLALALAMVGLYGLVSNEVEQATRDIGIRMALGATRNRILAMVMNRVAWMLGAGSAVGIVLTLIARRLIGMVIYFDAQKEAGGFLLTALCLVGAGLIAALIPAARAASIEPMQALRTE
jgi:predicted permease